MTSVGLGEFRIVGTMVSWGLVARSRGKADAIVLLHDCNSDSVM